MSKQKHSGSQARLTNLSHNAFNPAESSRDACFSSCLPNAHAYRRLVRRSSPGVCPEFIDECICRAECESRLEFTGHGHSEIDKWPLTSFADAKLVRSRFELAPIGSYNPASLLKRELCAQRDGVELRTYVSS